MNDIELLERIRQRRLSDLSDGMDAIGLVGTGVMAPAMRPLYDGMASIHPPGSQSMTCEGRTAIVTGCQLPYAFY